MQNPISRFENSIVDRVIQNTQLYFWSRWLSTVLLIGFLVLEDLNYAADMIIKGSWMARTIPTSSHDAVFVGIWTASLIFALGQKRIKYTGRMIGVMNFTSIYAVVFATMFLGGVCESMFNIAYYSFLVPTNAERLSIMFDGIKYYGAFALLVSAAIIPIYVKIYKIFNRKWLWVAIGSFAVYLAGWVAIGFPITVNARFGLSNLYSDPLTNAIEIVSWYVWIVPLVIAYLKGPREYHADFLF